MRSLPLGLVVASIAGAAACSSDPDPAVQPATSSTSTAATSGGGGAGGSPPAGEISGEVGRYEYAFDLETGAARSKLFVDVAAPGGDCFSIACTLEGLHDATLAGAPATLSGGDGLVSFCGAPVGPGPLEIEASATVPEQKFLGGLDIGFSRSADMDGGTFSYLLSWVGGCDHFGPCDDHPGRLAEFRFDVTHPAGTTVLCPGALTAAATTTSCEIAGTLAPTYSAFSIAADPLWVRSPFVTAGGVDLVFYEVPSGQLAASLDPASVTAFFEWITGVVGPYPYGAELRFAGAPTEWLGFEHPGSVILREDLPAFGGAYADATMHVFMHEVVHQWAGDKVTLASELDFVWKEATAEYLSYVFEDEQRPAAEAASALAYWDSVSLQAQTYPRPTDDPAPAVHEFYEDVYGPGPMVLYVQLESMLGRQVVLEAIGAFLAMPGTRSVDDLRLALEAASGEDLGAYFDAWVFGKGAPEWPTMTVMTSQAGDQVTVTVQQDNPSQTIYGCAVEVLVLGATQSVTATVDFGVAPTEASASAVVTLAEPVVGAVLDPRHRVVAKQPGVAAPSTIPPGWTLEPRPAPRSLAPSAAPPLRR